ncbi:WD40 repeat domain-containing protein [Nonomuraea sp. KM90]|uniref:WD40 repeat domain-containing protein n=1 Tax=Nonomuraea sp. KM90 TaxID=3457428 RepID=UPI003FCCB10A
MTDYLNFVNEISDVVDEISDKELKDQKRRIFGDPDPLETPSRARRGRLRELLPPWTGLLAAVCAFLFSAIGSLIAADIEQERDGHTTVTEAGGIHREVQLAADPLRKGYVATFNQEGTLLATAVTKNRRHVGTEDENVELMTWDAGTGRQVGQPLSVTGRIYALAFSPDGRILAAGGRQSVRLWDVSSWSQIATLTDYADLVTSLSFSSNGRVLATGEGHSVRLWDLDAGKEIGVVSGYADPVISVAFSPDGRRLATGDGHSVRLWDLDAGKETDVMTRYAASTTSLSFSSNGRVLAAGEGHSVRLWDLDAGKEIGVVSGYADPVISVAFSPDGRRLASIGGKGTVSLRDLPRPMHPPTT